MSIWKRISRRLKDWKDKGFRRELEEGLEPFEYFAQRINPKVVGLKKVKQGLLLSMVSLSDSHGDRNRLHVLLSGEPGTGKSQLLRWLKNKLGVCYAGLETSEVGLVGSAKGDNYVPGALAEANNSTLAIDEFDKLSREERVASLEAMSDGSYTIRKGSVKREVDAEARLIVSANDTSRFSKEALQRFDLKFKLEKPNAETQKKIARERVSSWGKYKRYGGQELKKYLDWVSDYNPTFNEEARSEMKAELDSLIDWERDCDELSALRSKESVIRIALALARLRHRNVTREDVEDAVNFWKDCKEE